MIKIPHHSRWLSGIAVFPAIGALLLVSDAALGIDTRYRDYGPVVQDGPTLDMSMLVTNAKIEEQYEAEALIAQLHTPVVDQERMTDVASATLLPSWAGPEREDTDFGLAVSDDRSLDESLVAFTLERATTGGDLFIQIAEAASAPGRQIDADIFTLVAAMLGDRWSADELREEVERARSAFGTTVTDGPTLQRSLIALSDRLQELEAQELVLTAQGPPSVTGASFQTFALAITND